MDTYGDEDLFHKQLLEDEHHARVAFGIMGFVVAMILLYLVYLTFRPAPPNQEIPQSPIASSPTPLLEPTGCLSCNKPTATISSVPFQPVITSGVKDYFIPLGSGTLQSTEWQNVPGVQAIVDFGQYPKIKNIYPQYISPQPMKLSLLCYTMSQISIRFGIQLSQRERQRLLI
jgi:hypothetical protein